VFADGVLNRAAALRDFFANVRAGFKRQQRMSECVISDYVAASSNLSRDIGPLLHVFADLKERCMNVVLRKNVQQMESVRVVRAIVEGERKLP
jgi:hypothetical protein